MQIGYSRKAKGCSKRPMFTEARLCYLSPSAGVKTKS